ncbi:DUF4386 domain-containing protein [Streptomyces anandii]|uniref:DUF4386 domain-containing protein n=1 Tax=Streptomyces anandii TaxID=285454 RepID=UPI000ADE7E0B|nr:DUF4386 domain-containing protein [Streptomyces anandii]GGY12930.1 hypothetical protein GCM10010510_68750 [Streptomyces anandii JCM 4720]
MVSPRKLAAAAGLCYLVTHAASIGGLVLYGPVLNNSGYVLGRGPDTRVLLGALSEVILALAIIGTAVTLFPVARRHNEALAAGYLGLRTLEASVIIVGVVSLLSVVTMRRHATHGPHPDAALLAVDKALVAAHDWTFLIGPDFVCGANTVLMAYVMYRAGLVPRFIACLGLIGGPLIFASAIAVLFGAYPQISVWGSLTAIPVFAWELSLAIWLLAKGFKPSPLTALPGARTPAAAGRP